ncbi:MAG: elongation factor Ts [Lachnospiraceae bacterium]|nr:elongation factor Ts [Lachnospiraceae bacterium]
MAAVTAAMVKELREMTGAGMMDCKKALAQTDGDMDKAVDFLREKGLAASAKKAGRIAAEGIAKTLVSEDGKTGVVVEVNSETDFVAKNADFQEYVGQVAVQAMNSDAADMDAFMSEKWYLDDSKTVAEALSGKVAVIGENLKIRRYEKVAADNGIVVDYVHAGGKIGVLVVAECPAVNDDVKEALKNIAMQIAALKPVYVNRSEISEEFIEKEKEILMVAAKNEKPDANEKVLTGMVMGRLNKELKEFCLVDQVYVKAEDGKQLVGKYLEEVAKKAGTTLAVTKFVRYETGEGLEKKNENFAEEVAKQMGM